MIGLIKKKKQRLCAFLEDAMRMRFSSLDGFYATQKLLSDITVDSQHMATASSTEMKNQLSGNGVCASFLYQKSASIQTDVSIWMQQVSEAQKEQ